MNSWWSEYVNFECANGHLDLVLLRDRAEGKLDLTMPLFIVRFIALS